MWPAISAYCTFVTCNCGFEQIYVGSTQPKSTIIDIKNQHSLDYAVYVLSVPILRQKKKKKNMTLILLQLYHRLYSVPSFLPYN